MINGVLLIMPAVLFAVLYLFEGLGVMWLRIAGFYFVAGVLDLVMHVVKEKAKVRAANKQAARTAKEADESRKLAEEAKKKLEEPKQEEKV
jgi:hypothetical protein